MSDKSDRCDPSDKRKGKIMESGIITLVSVAINALAAIFAPWVAPYDPYYTDLTKVMLPPAGIASRELITRLVITCSNRRGSAGMGIISELIV